MEQKILYLLDAETKDEEFRVTTFSLSFDDLIRDFSNWMKERDVTFPEVKYAIIYRTEDNEPVADLIAGEDGIVELIPRPEDTSLKHRVVKRFKKLLGM